MLAWPCPQNALTMHEDMIDAVFVCWKFFAGMASLSPQVYRRVLDNALKQERNA